MNPHYRNPAGRLWLFLVHSRTRGSDDDAVLTVWAEYLGVDAAYSADLFAGVAEVVRLPGEVRDAVAAGRVPTGEEEAVRAAADQAEWALGIASRLDRPMRELRERYPPETLWVLKRASAWLNDPVAVPGSSGGAPVEDARARAEALTSLLESDETLAPEMRGELLQRCSGIVRAARLVPVAGFRVLGEELHHLSGLLALRPDIVRAVRGSQEISGAVREVFRSLRTFDGHGRVPGPAADWRAFAELVGDEPG